MGKKEDKKAAKKAAKEQEAAAAKAAADASAAAADAAAGGGIDGDKKKSKKDKKRAADGDAEEVRFVYLFVLFPFFLISLILRSTLLNREKGNRVVLGDKKTQKETSALVHFVKGASRR